MQLLVGTRARARKLWKEKEKDESKRKKGGKRQKEERETNEDGEAGRKKGREIQKVQISKKMKSVGHLMTDLDTPRQRKAVKQGEKNDKGRKKKLFSSQ